MSEEYTDPASLQTYLQRIEESIEQVKGRLKRFEEEFGMDSQEFYARLQNKELDERIEYAEWAGEHEMLRRLNQQRDQLKKRLEGEA